MAALSAAFAVVAVAAASVRAEADRWDEAVAVA
jgi:hypothetical protein